MFLHPAHVVFTASLVPNFIFTNPRKNCVSARLQHPTDIAGFGVSQLRRSWKEKFPKAVNFQLARAKWRSCLGALSGLSSRTQCASFIHVLSCLPSSLWALPAFAASRRGGIEPTRCLRPSLRMPGQLHPVSGSFALPMMKTQKVKADFGSVSRRRWNPFLPCISEVSVSETWRGWLQALLLRPHPQRGIQVTQ